ncbi:UNVERIFIED_CONTAM: hypothetical protein Sradi_1875100 [Sesamum radiatum]|uniref:Uncharacterized protein n=1 Tax=Sesamum radiatum TaxID=300843 RepID=A0AAW2TXQ4_SESRA
MVVLKEIRSPGPTKESGKDLIEFFTPRNGLKHSTSPELCTFQEDYLTTTLSALKPLRLKTKRRRHFDSEICGCTTIPSFKTVKQSWELPIKGYGMYKLQQKIYRTKELLK